MWHCCVPADNECFRGVILGPTVTTDGITTLTGITEIHATIAATFSTFENNLLRSSDDIKEVDQLIAHRDIWCPIKTPVLVCAHGVASRL